MKIAPVMVRTAIVDDLGRLTPKWSSWLQEVADTKMRVVEDTAAVTVAPEMKKHEMIIFITASTTYLVYYDGTIRYYWEITGTDLF